MAGTKKHDSKYRKLEFENGRLTFVWHGVKYCAEKSPTAAVATQLKKGDLVELVEGSTPEKPVVHCAAREITETAPWKMAGVLKKALGTGPVTEAEKQAVLGDWKGGTKKATDLLVVGGSGPQDLVRGLALDLGAEKLHGELYTFKTLEHAMSFRVAAVRAGKNVVDFPEKLAVFVKG